MMGFPPGEWSQILVGDQWPDDQELKALAQGKTNRESIRNRLADFADALRNARPAPLIDREGSPADDPRTAFRQGEAHARNVAKKNGTKATAYETAYDSMLSLQNDLTALADEG